MGGGGGGFPRGLGGPGGGGGGLPLFVQNDLNQSGAVALDASALLSDSPAWPVAVGLQIFAQFFPDLFGNGEPKIPWYDVTHTQRGAHGVYNHILNIAADWIVTQRSSAPSFNSVNDAVMAAAKAALAKTAQTGNESEGAIVRLAGTGKYTYTGPNNTGSHCDGRPYKPADAVATYHTHPDTCEDGVPAAASGQDLEFAIDSQVPLYYIEPDGTIHILDDVPGPPAPLQRK